MQERHSMVPAVYMVMRKDNQVLALLRENTGYMDNHWSLPAGHVEKGELPINGAIREAKEEVGVTIAVEDLEFVHLMIRPAHDATGERMDVFFEAYKWEGEPVNNEPDKHSKVEWVDVNDLSKIWVPYQRTGLEDILRGVKYSELKE